jgi:formiminotetrahydrofolate cyclodeaminase
MHIVVQFILVLGLGAIGLLLWLMKNDFASHYRADADVQGEILKVQGTLLRTFEDHAKKDDERFAEIAEALKLMQDLELD